MIRRHLIAFILSFFLLAVLKPVIVFAQTPIGIINEETNGDLIFDDGTSSEFIRFIKSSRTVSLGDGSSNTHLDLTGFLRLTQPVGVTGSCNPGELYFNGTEVRVCGASNQWENIVTASNSPFGIISGTPDVISNSNGDPSTDDFVFGSDKLDWSSGDEERRFFFDKDKAAFRAGFADDNYWDLGSRGDYSAAFGYNTTASGVKSFATGGLAKASGDYSIALGESLDIAGENTVGIGKNLKTTEDYAMIIGRGFDGTEITNNQDNSLMIGFNSDVPTMIVTADPTGGVGTIGNVGIGNAAPNYRLDVTGTAHVDALNINGQYSLPTSNGTTNQFLRGDGTWQTPPSGLTSTGTANYIPKFTNPSAIENSLIYDDGTNIGIGLTSPDATLHLQALGANIKIENLNGTPALNLYHNGAYAAGQSLGDIAFERQNSGGTDIVFSSISGHVSDHSSSSEDGYITFSTIAAGTSSEKMRIENDGKIGIGTTNIKNKLHVFGGASGVTGSTYSGGVLIENSGNAELRMLTPDVRSSAIFFGNATNDIQAGFAYNFSGNGHLQILAGSGGVPRIIIESGGNVGIGNTNPQQKLHVTGNARIESLALAGTNRLVTVTSDGDLNYLTNATTDVTDKYLRADGTWEIPPGTGNGIYGTSDAISGNHTVSINSSDVLDFDITNSGSLRVLDNGTSAFKIDGDGQILIPDRIYHDGDLNTFFGFPNDDQFFMLAGNKLLIHANAVGSQDELKLGNAGYGDDVDIYIGGDFFYDDGLNNIGIGTTVPGQKLQIEGNLRLSSGTNYVEFKQPTGTYGTHSYTLPSTIPAGNKVLQSNSGILSWVDDSDNQTLTISSTGTSHDIIIANGNTVNISEDQTLSLNNNSGDAEVAISGVTGSKVTLKAGTGIGFTFGGSNDLTIDASGAGDDLGDHIATSNIQLNGKWLSGDGGDEGVFVDGNGNVGIGDGTPDYKLDIYEEKNSTGTDSAIAQYTTIKQTNSAVSMGNFSLVKSTGGGTQYGYFADLQNTGTGSKVGYRVFIDENASSHANTLDGYLSNVINSGMGVAYGFRGTVVGSGTGDLYGLELTMSGGGGGQVIGLNVVGEEKNYLSGNVGIGSLAPTQKLDVKGNLALTNASNQTVAFIPNAGMTASHAYTLPDALPTSTKVLQSNASGDLSWVADGDVDAGNEFQNLGHNDVSTGNHEITINSGTNVTFGETQDLAHLLDQGNIGDDGDHIQIDEIRARDGDGLALEDDGGNGIFIQDGGNVGIGVASPNTKLNVDGGTGLSDLLSDKGFFLIGDVTDRNMVFDDNEIQGRNNGLAEPLLLQKNGGNVGIGTSSTSSRLHIKGSNGDFPVVTYENNTGDYQNFVRLIPPVSGIGATGDIANDVFNGKLYYRKTTGWEEIAVGTSDNLYNADGALPGSTRQVSFGSGAKLNFDANTFLIDGDANNVGVGTDAPISQLHIFANSNGGGISPTSGSLLTLENSSSAYMSIFTADNAESGIVFGNTSLDVDGAIVYKDNATATAEQMELRVNNNATVMTLEGTGNVGIGSAD
ncbi:MAG: hypothetical protein MRY83_12255, partial [Flavobacteriales bacterium]|nr:hypothetical protein [Flavobacteriales bacterium]